MPASDKIGTQYLMAINMAEHLTRMLWAFAMASEGARRLMSLGFASSTSASLAAQ